MELKVTMGDSGRARRDLPMAQNMSSHSSSFRSKAEGFCTGGGGGGRGWRVSQAGGGGVGPGKSFFDFKLCGIGGGTGETKLPAPGISGGGGRPKPAVPGIAGGGGKPKLAVPGIGGGGIALSGFCRGRTGSGFEGVVFEVSWVTAAHACAADSGPASGSADECPVYLMVNGCSLCGLMLIVMLHACDCVFGLGVGVED